MASIREVQRPDNSVSGSAGMASSVYHGITAFLQSHSNSNAKVKMEQFRYFFPTLPEVIQLDRSAEYKNEHKAFMPEPFLMYQNPAPCVVNLTWSTVADGRKMTMQQIMSDAAFLHSLVLPLGAKAGEMTVATKCILVIGEWFNAEGVVIDVKCGMKEPWDLPRTLLPRSIDMGITFQVAELYNTKLGITDYSNDSLLVKHDAKSVRDSFYGSAGNKIINIRTDVTTDRLGP